MMIGVSQELQVEFESKIVRGKGVSPVLIEGTSEVLTVRHEKTGDVAVMAYDRIDFNRQPRRFF
jgi:hypothetical protein